MTKQKQDECADANTLLATGAGIAAIGVAGAVLGGAVCPVCVVAAPALLGVGAWKRIRAKRARPEPEPSPET